MFNQQTCGEIEQPGNSSPAQILGSNGTTNGWPFYEFEPVLGVNHYKPHLFLSSEKLLASPNPAPKGLTMSHRSSWKLWVRRAHLWSTSTGAHLQCQPMRLNLKVDSSWGVTCYCCTVRPKDQQLVNKNPGLTSSYFPTNIPNAVGYKPPVFLNHYIFITINPIPLL